MMYTHPHMPVIHMETAVELLGQEIAQRVAAREDAGDNKARSDALTVEITALRKRQQALRSDDPAGVQAVFDEFGRSAAG